MAKPKHLLVQPYDINFYLFAPCSDEELKAFVDNRVSEPYQWDDDFESGGRCMAIGGGKGCVVVALSEWNCTVKDLGYLAHECFHAVEYIMRSVGCPNSDESSEAWAYLLSYLFEWSLKNMPKVKGIK